MKKICYGLAIPGLVVGCVLYTHMPAKYSMSPLLKYPGNRRCFSPVSLREDLGQVSTFVREHKDPLHRLVVSPYSCSGRSGSGQLITSSSCVAFNCVISFIIAESIPFFNDLVGLIGALLGTFICM